VIGHQFLHRNCKLSYFKVRSKLWHSF